MIGSTNVRGGANYFEIQTFKMSSDKMPQRQNVIWQKADVQKVTR